MKIKNLLPLIIATTSLFSSCKKNTIHKNESSFNNPNVLSEEKMLQTKLNFGNALAISLKDQELRTLIKNEALKQFDHDYDVLFASIKDIKLTNGKTVLENIASNSSNQTDFIQSVLALPLINIFVPNFDSFSANNWDTSTQIPVVAVLNEKDADNGEKDLPAFDKDGNSLKLKYKTKPEFPVVVLKDNERVILSSTPSAKLMSANMVSTHSIANLGSRYRFIDPAFNNQGNANISIIRSTNISTVTTESNTLRPPTADNVWIEDANILYAANRNLNAQRDYIYYGIDSTQNVTSGKYRTTYAEHITSIQMETEAAIAKITDDWTEGNLEIVISIAMINRDGNSQALLRKAINCTPQDLIEDGRRGTKIIKEYSGFAPIELDTWDAYKYGDKWKFIVSEYDPGIETTTSTTVGSSFSGTTGVNIGFDLFGILKIGGSGGGTNSENKSTTVTIKSTNTSDDLYEGILNFSTPIYAAHQMQRGDIGYGRDPDIVLKASTVKTSAIKLRVEPRKRAF